MVKIANTNLRLFCTARPHISPMSNKVELAVIPANDCWWVP